MIQTYATNQLKRKQMAPGIPPNALRTPIHGFGGDFLPFGEPNREAFWRLVGSLWLPKIKKTTEGHPRIAFLRGLKKKNINCHQTCIKRHQTGIKWYQTGIKRK